MAEQFLNSWYRNSKMGYDTDTRKYVTLYPDTLIYTTKDTETLETKLHVWERPTIDFYVTKHHQPFHKISVPKSECMPIKVKYADRDKEIAQYFGKLDEFYNSKKNGSFYDFKKSLMSHPDLYLAEMNIEDFWKTKCMIKNGDGCFASRYNMAFADIEVDISNFTEDFPDSKVAPVPINIMTAIYAETKDLYTFILYDPRVSDTISWIVQNPDEFVRTCLDEDIRKVGFKFHFSVYKTELDLIKSFFEVMHYYKPDFLGFWNMNFDVPTILNRLKRLGCKDDDIADIICHPDVPKKFRYVRYIEDPKRSMYEAGSLDGEDDDDSVDDEQLSKNAKNKPHPSRLVDWVEAPGYTQIYDQLATFSCLRKRTLYPSYKLDDIGEQFAGQKKLSLEDAGLNIKTANINDFKTFMAYNIRDVFVQYSIELKQKDMWNNVIFSDNTRISKAFNMSTLIANQLMLYLWKHDEIMGNTVTYHVPHEDLEGAIVGDPRLLEQEGIDIGGKSSFVFNNSIDLDYSSLYPSIIITSNIFKSALFGRVVDVVKPSTTNPEGESLGKGEGLFELLQTLDQGLFTITKDYMGLPDPEEFIKSINETAILKADGKL